MYACLLKTENCCAIGRKGIVEGVGLPVALSFGGGVDGSLSQLVGPPAVVQQKGVSASFGNAYPVIGPFNRREADNKEKIFPSCLIASYKAENTSVPIIGIHPLEAVPVRILTVKRRIFLIKVKQISNIALQLLVLRLLGEIPV